MMHKSLFLNKAIDLLITNKNGVYIDCTFGLGGHSTQILNRLSEKGKLIAIDKDFNTQKVATHLGITLDKRFHFFNTNFSFLENIVTKNLFGKVSGILLDLGISKNQIKDFKRGFSFYINGPLNMKLNNQTLKTLGVCGVTAFEVLNNYKSKKLIQILKTYGEENASYIYILTKKICKRRIKNHFKMTLELSNLIKQTLHLTSKYNKYFKHFKNFNKLNKYFTNQHTPNIPLTLNNKNNTPNTQNTTQLPHRRAPIIKKPLTDFKKKLTKTTKTINNIKNIRKHPATKVFQAIRSYINNDIQNLETIINSSFKILKKNKTLIIITFNSLETKKVKQVTKQIKQNIKHSFKTSTSIEEVKYNISSRCAKLYILKPIPYFK